MIDRRDLVRHIALQEFVKSAADEAPESEQSWMDYLIDRGANAYSSSRDYIAGKVDQAGKYLDSSPRYNRFKTVAGKRLGGYVDSAIDYIDPEHNSSEVEATQPQSKSLPESASVNLPSVQPRTSQEQYMLPTTAYESVPTIQTAPSQPSQQPSAAISKLQIGKLKGGYYDLAKKLRSETGMNYTGAQLAKMFGNKSLRATDTIDLDSLRNNKASLTNADLSARKSIQSRAPIKSNKPSVSNTTVTAPAAVAKPSTRYSIPETRLELSSQPASSGFSYSSNPTNSAPKPTTANNKSTQYDEDLE